MQKIAFRTEDGVALEGDLRTPDGGTRGSAVLCHAHPRHGGSKDHPVLWQVRIALSRLGLVALGFNFRGVMGSGGSYDGGVREVLDARAAVGRVREEATGPTVLFGWSFGANVALRAAIDDERVRALVLTGIPLAATSLRLPPLPDDGRLGTLGRPVLLAVGEEDAFAPLDMVRDLAGRIPEAEVEVLAGTDHFFPQRERELGERVAEFVDRALRAERE
ncbi:MAG: alpha/beta hydrolase [Actinobacteria bacterium]|nr:alpha/beta hydrolase [Actinomycetota bacterium]